MNTTLFKKILLSLFILVSLVIIVYGLLFIVSQMVNIKYYFDHSLPNPIYSNENTIPICRKEFFQELILFAKIIVGYAIFGLILGIYYIRKK
jgi:predicted branched-subunit amino acid permease